MVLQDGWIGLGHDVPPPSGGTGEVLIRAEGGPRSRQGPPFAEEGRPGRGFSPVPTRFLVPSSADGGSG